MGLLKPTPGEVVDRLCILELKIAACVRKTRDFSHFEKETKELVDYLNNNRKPLDSVKFDTLWNDLKQINATLWRLEDERRELLKATQKDVLMIVDNAERTTFLNDQRSNVISEVNKLFLITAQEKLYGP